MGPLLAAGIIGGVKAAGAGINYLLNRKKKPPKFANTEYGRYLKQLSEQGMYNPALRQSMMGQAGRESGNVAGQHYMQSKGYLTSRGMGNSVAGARLLAQSGIERQRAMQGFGERMTVENEQSKQTALSQYVQGVTGADEQRRLESKQNVSNLIGGLTDAATSGLGAYMQGKQMENTALYQQGMVTARNEANRINEFKRLQELTRGTIPSAENIQVMSHRDLLNLASENKYPAHITNALLEYWAELKVAQYGEGE